MTHARKKSIRQPSPPKAAVGVAGSDQHWRVAGLCLLLAAMTFAVFGQTAGFGFANFDDNVYVYENAKLADGLSLKGLAWVFTHADCYLYHPLTMLSLMGDYQFHGLHAGGYHFTNVLLHTASVILLFLVLRQMTGAFWRSAFVAAVFAIHPLRVESVAWVAERKDVLSGFFFMLTLGAYARYVRKPNSPARYLVVAAAFVLALLSKPTVVTLPFVLLLLDYWPLHRFEQPGPDRPPEYFGIPKRLILEKIPLLALAVAACVVTVRVVREGSASSAHVSALARFGNALVSYAVYLRQLVWPEGLTPFYPLPEKGYPVWTIALSFLLLALISGGLLAFGRKRRWLWTGWLWYLGMLTPMIGIVQVGEFAHADRMTYLPQIGIYVALTWLMAEMSAGWRYRCATLGGLTAIILGALIFCARTQTAYWEDSETLWNHTLACTTNNATAHLNLGNVLFKKGRVDEAIPQFQQALQIKPNDAQTRGNFGSALLQKGRVDEAIPQFEKALQIRPDFADAHNKLGLALDEKGRVDEAIAQFQNALEIRPDFADAHNDLAAALDEQGRVDEAISHYQKALQIEPANPAMQNNLAWLLATCADAPLRNGNKAVELAQQANALTGGENPMILHTLAAAFAEAGRYSEAVETAQHALHLAEAQSNTDLTGALQSEMKLYQAGRPFHSPAPTH